MKETNSTALFILGVVLTAAIFTADILTPLGIAWGFLYIIVVLITLWIPGRKSTLFFTAAGIILAALKFYVSTSEVVAIEIVITNRLLSVIGIAVTMFGILKYKEKERLVFEQKKELEKLSEELKISNGDLEQFAYVASHDLQEPLRKIQSFGDRIVSTEKEKLSEQGKDYLSRMMNAAERMQKLINDLLSFSRLSTKTEPMMEVDLNKLAVEVISDLEVLIERTHSKIEVGSLPTIRADASQMRQLFQNLITNGIKFRKENQNSVVKIYSSKTKAGDATHRDFYELFFEDNGIGFDEKYSEKIFNIFQRLEGQKYEGSGIGLSVCKKIALKHGGDIRVKSKPGEGSVFIVSLPATVV